VGSCQAILAFLLVDAAMSTWIKVTKEDLELDGDEINIYVKQDYSGAVYVTIKVEDIKALLAGKA
jgi:hypothetical protein